jgi:hypothetical protein
MLAHINIANPIAKYPSRPGVYSDVDLGSLDDDFLPSSFFSPGEDCIFRKSVNSFTFDGDSNKKIFGNYKYVNRKLAKAADSRTLISSILPPNCVHTDSLFSISFDDNNLLLTLVGASHSIIYDFLIRTVNKDNVRHELIGKLPILRGNFGRLVSNRALRLNCLTNIYSDLWIECSNSEICDDSWTSRDERLMGSSAASWSELDHKRWENIFSLTGDFERRQALLEIDILVAMAFGIEIEELIKVYEIHFTAFSNYERIDIYDSFGNRIPNTQRRDSGGKEARDAFADYDGSSSVIVSWEIDNGNRTVTKTFYPPFTHVDRFEDYKTAYRVFSERLGLTENKEVS